MRETIRGEAGRPEPDPEPFEARSRGRNAPFWLFASALFLIAVVADPLAKDWFRMPKELLFRTAGIASFLLLVFRWRGEQVRTNGWRSFLAISLAIPGWTLITTATSTNRALSVDSLITVICGALFFLGAAVSIRDSPSFRWLDALLPCTLITALLAMAQEFKLWQPFDFPKVYEGHLSTTAFLGNPNDAGVFLVIPAVAFAVAVGATTGRRRTVYGLSALVLAGGLIACGTRTALMAYVLALLSTAAHWTRRKVLLYAPLAVLFAMAMVFTLRGRGLDLALEAAKNRRFDFLVSERLPAFLTAIEMARDHPLIGTGPGTYKWHYLPYRIEISREYPQDWTRGSPLNFREAHNDHLQILAETGLPGYALFVLAAAAVVVLGRRGGNRLPGSIQFVIFTDRLRWPFAVVTLLVMLAQFPLQLAASRAMILFICALCTWDRQ